MKFHYVITFFCPVTGFVHSVSVKRHSVIRTIEKCDKGSWASKSQRIKGNTGYTWINHTWTYSGSIDGMHVEIVVFN